MDGQPGFFARLWMALVLFWKLLFDRALAGRVRGLLEARKGAEAPSTAPVTAEPAGPDPTPALQVLAILQREGRLLDFLTEDVAAFSDAEVGAAARVIHAGCKRGLDEYVSLKPVRPEPEGAPVTLEPGFDPARTRITGTIVGSPPYRGRLAHHGWEATRVTLPTLTDGHDARVLAPAEVELEGRA